MEGQRALSLGGIGVAGCEGRVSSLHAKPSISSVGRELPFYEGSMSKLKKANGCVERS